MKASSYARKLQDLALAWDEYASAREGIPVSSPGRVTIEWPAYFGGHKFAPLISKYAAQDWPEFRRRALADLRFAVIQAAQKAGLEVDTTKRLVDYEEDDEKGVA